MPKSDDQASTRDRILRAAVEEIAHKGLGGARTRSIAERAGVNNALVHYHFKTMDDLVVEAAATVFTGLADMASGSLAASSVIEGLEEMNDLVATIDPDEPGWQVLLEAMVHTRRRPRLGAFVLGWLDEYREALRERLEGAITDGELPESIDPEGLSLALMALYDGLGLYGYVNPDLDIRRAGRSINDLLRALADPGGGAGD